MTLSKSKILITCGSGGVGKTTLSATLALKHAEAGKKAIVLTIDPAKRLATALGLKNLCDEAQKINIGKSSKGEMWAMMLDTKRTFDRLIEHYASSEEAKNKILNNRLYQHMSHMLSGTQEYMAMERLYEIQESNLYDVIIIDTPPMQNARDFLIAPQKMMNMINNSMLHILLKPTFSLGKSSFKLLEKGTEQILKIFDRITGFAFMQDISEMLLAFKDLLTGFEKRAKLVEQLLRSPQCHFLIVCTALQNSLEEADDFIGQLQKLDYSAQMMIVNRVYQGDIFSSNELNAVTATLTKQIGKTDAEILVNNYKHYIPLIKKDQEEIKRLKKKHPGLQISAVPLYLSDVHDISSLKLISEYLN